MEDFFFVIATINNSVKLFARSDKQHALETQFFYVALVLQYLSVYQIYLSSFRILTKPYSLQWKPIGAKIMY